MTNKIKKVIASLVAVAALSTCATGISASADGISETVYFHANVGAPGSATYISEEWSYTTSLLTSTINVSDFSASVSNTHIFAFISVGGLVKAAGNIYPTSGQISASGLPIGKSAYACAEVNTSSGNIASTVSISG